MIFFERTENIIGGSCHKYHFCRDKYVFAATKHVFCRDKSMLVATKLLSPQTRVCRHIFATIFFILLSRQKTRLSRQKLYLWQLPPMIEKGPSSIERTLELFQRQRWGNFLRDGVECIIMGFSQRMDSMNWTGPKHIKGSKKRLFIMTQTHLLCVWILY